VTQASRAVLLIEDEPQIRHVLRSLLETEQFRVIEAENAERGLAEARSHKPDLIILDLGLPDRDGLAIIGRVREWSRVPIIVLSARADERNKVSALEAGADDYVTKPFSALELKARIQVALRHAARTAGSADAVIAIGRWRIDLMTRSAVAADDGSALHLTPIEFRLLEVLSQHLGLVVTHRQMLQHVWGPASAEQRNYLRVYMKQLRQKLEPDPARPRWLLTDTGIGYRLVQDVDQ
jgi:two-component system KDP operon response regulator KdpE